uniref:hypothetical protein n=1 Tax=Hassallia byssoidea TaxID=482630 RepID=UPI000AD0CDF9|nr:hypothetical protein [Hassalia byssoidea]
MQVHYKKVLFDLAFWLITEVILNLVGLDDLANYSEFIFANDSTKFSSYSHQIAIQLS